MEILGKELEERRLSLSEKTEVLDSKLKLDEPAIADALRLLKQINSYETNDEPSASEDILAIHVDKLKQLNQAWQSCVINHQKIDEFAGTVLDMYGKAAKCREETLERFAKADAIAPDTLTWPPTTQHITQERQVLNVLEQNWGSLQQTQLKAIQTVVKLIDLSERYRSLSGQLERLVDIASQEQGRVKEFEKRLDKSRKMWLRQSKQSNGNRILQSERGKLT